MNNKEEKNRIENYLLDEFVVDQYRRYLGEIQDEGRFQNNPLSTWWDK
jgi:hypothetical protein